MTINVDPIGRTPVFVNSDGSVDIRNASTGSDLMTISSSGVVAITSATVSGAVAANSLSATGAVGCATVSCTSVAATSVSTSTLTTTGVATVDSLSTTGAVGCTSVACNGPVAGTTVTATGAIIAAAPADDDGTQVLCIGSTAEGMSLYRLEETVDFDGNEAGYKAMSNGIPAGAVIVGVQANIETVVTDAGSGDCVGIGLNGSDPDAYGKTTNLTANQKITTVPTRAVLSAETTLEVCGVVNATGGLTDGNVTAGTVRVVITYELLPDLADVE